MMFSRSRLSYIIALLLLAGVTHNLNAATRYVKGGASGAGDGTSWANAYPELVQAITAAQAGDEIWVAGGVYFPDYNTATGTHNGDRTLRFALKSDVFLFGGFAGTESNRSQRNWAANRTILSGDIGQIGVFGDNTRTLMGSNSTVTNVVVEGFVFAAGNADDPAELGGGIIGGSGGAVFVRGAIEFRQCVFVGNSALYGGAIAIQPPSGVSSALTVTNCLFANNSATNVGGAINNASGGGDFVVRHCTIINNSSARGAAIATNASAVCQYHNNIIHANTATGTGWQKVETGSASSTLINNILEIALVPTGTGNLVTSNVRFVRTPSSGPDLRWGTMDDVLQAPLLQDSPAVEFASGAQVPTDRTDADGDSNVMEPLPYDLLKSSRTLGVLTDAGAFEFVNSAPTSISLNTPSVAEGVAAGAQAGVLFTVDPEGGTITYSLVPGTGDTDNARFTLAANKLVTVEVLDFETLPTCSVRIRATDVGGLWTEAAFTIQILNVTEQEVGVLLNGVDLADNTGIASFGDVDLGGIGTTRVFTVKNTGGIPLTGISVRMTVAGTPEFFTLNSTGMATTLAAGASTTFTLKCAPVAEGEVTANVEVLSNDEDEGIFEIQVSATGAKPVAGFDPSWAAGGRLSVSVAGYSLTPNDAVVGPDGSLYTVGTGYNGSTFPYNRAVITKLLPSGAVDTSFGTAGTAIVYRPSSDTFGHAIALQSDGKLLVGCVYNAQVTVFRLTSAGVVDTTFSGASFNYAAVYISSDVSNIVSIASQVDGGFLVLCSVGSSQNTRVVRFLANGFVDNNFGSSGLAQSPSGSTVRRPMGMILQSDGKILINTITGTGGSQLAVKIKYHSNGLLDNNFGTAGVLGSNTILPNMTVQDVQTDAAGRTMFLGGANSGASNLQLYRIQPDLMRDTTFSLDGYVAHTIGVSVNQPAGFLQRPDGRFFVAGIFNQGFSVVRFRPDGELDTNYDLDAVATLGTGDNMLVRGVRARSDGKLLVFGSTSTTSSASIRQFSWAAFNPGELESNAAPVITQELVSQTVNLGAPVTLTVGLAPNLLVPWYRWSRNGTVITTANQYNGPTIPISAASLADEGTYTVEVGNYAGVVTSTCTLTLFAPPKFTVEPVGYSGPRGIDYDLKATVVGRPPFTFQWQLNNADVIPPVVNSSGSHTYTVPADAAHAGSYRVIVTNADGSATSTPVTLMPGLSPPVGGLDQSTIETMVYGDTFDISGHLSGITPYTIQWQKDGKNLGSPLESSSRNFYLTLPRALATSGTYRCIVTNADGQITTDEVVVKVWPNPTIRLDRTNIVVNEGSGVGFESRVYSLSTPTRFQWQFNSKNIAQADSNSGSFYIDPVTFAQAGAYRVLMGTLGGTATSNTTQVSVIERGSRTIVAAAGKTASITAKTVGKGLFFHWTRGDGSALPASGYTGIDTATLQIPNVGEQHEGVYACYVSSVDNPPVPVPELTLVVESLKPVLDPDLALPPGAVGQTYDYPLSATNNASSFVVTGLPSGLACHPLTGRVSGTPKVGGTFTVKVSAVNPVGSSAVSQYSLVIAPLASTARGSFSGTLRPYGGSVAFGTFNLTIGSDGVYSGKIYFTRNSGHLYTASFKGQWSGSDGALSSYSSVMLLSATGTTDGPHSAYFYLGWDPTYGISGYLYETGAETTVEHYLYPRQNVWNARTRPATAYAGYYTAALNTTGSSNDATGNGYSTFTVGTGGTFTFAGRLPDGTAIAVPTFVGAEGQCQVFAWLHGYRGQLLGDVGLVAGNPPNYSDSGVNGNLTWNRPASTFQAKAEVYNSYFNGVQRSFDVVGARYLRPNYSLVTGPLVMDLPTTQPTVRVRLAGGDLYNTATGYATINTRNTATFDLEESDASVRFGGLSFNPATGTFSGKFVSYELDGAGGVSSIAHAYSGVISREDPGSTRGFGAGCFTLPRTYRIYDDYNYDPPRLVQKFNVLFSGTVRIDAW